MVSNENLIIPAGPPNDPIELYINAKAGCEWGNCGEKPMALRWDAKLYGDNGYAWVAVCLKHTQADPDKPLDRKRHDD